MVPKVSKWGFRGGICIEKWSQNFDSGTRSAIFGTPKIAKNTQNDPEADKEVEQVAKEAADTLEAVVEALCWRSTSLYNQ